MLLEKLKWVSHQGEQSEACAIYSIDMHPDGSRFATGGGDNTIRIWDSRGLLEPWSEGEEEEEEDEAAPEEAGGGGGRRQQLLAALANHAGGVLAVRFSHRGRYLASASDDQLIMIWELKPGEASSVPFGSTALPNKENWSRVFTLRGHSMDVLDVAWSPDDSKLASCSIDNSVLVWGVRQGARGRQHVLTPLRALKRHTSWVKGVCWDPVGKYLASAGEDGRCCVWRAGAGAGAGDGGGGDWGLEAEVTGPYAGASGAGAVSSAGAAAGGAQQQTFFRRIGWSPDGGHLAATAAAQRGLPTCCLVGRGRWAQGGVDLVGHARPVGAARFNPRLLASDAAAAAAGRGLRSALALGGQDATVSVWAAAAARPVAVLRDCFDQAVTDLCWSREGDVLLASSFDGTVCAFKFDPAELGHVVPIPRHRRFLEETFGVRVAG